jgi:STE24 endopeptidase
VLKIYLILILLIYILKEAFEYFLQYLNLKHVEKIGLLIPPEFEGEVDTDLLRKIHDYMKDKTRFSFISSISSNIITIVFFFGGLLDIYNSWISSLSWSFMLTGLLFFLLLSYASTLISVPFNLYSTFKIENKYGFNTTTLKLWITDFLKTIILSTVLITVIVLIALWLIQSNPYYWWIWIWGFFLVFSFFMIYISPYVIEPLFNKFTPIDEKGLEEKIKELMQKVNIKVSRVFKMDASKRSRHTNAYFSGIGRVKRIIFYDTLLEKMDHDEILAVLAHEAGHWKKKHVLKTIIAVEFISFIGTYISFRIIQSGLLTDIFHISHETFFAKVIILAFMGSIISLPFIPLGNYILRRFEKEADRFAYEFTTNKNAMISALIKLSKDNLSNLRPHPLYAAIYYSHPPVIQRIRAIKTPQD